MSIEVLKLVLETLIWCEPDCDENTKGFELWSKVMPILRTELDNLQFSKKAIAEAENQFRDATELIKQEPVAWIDDSGHPKHISYRQSVAEKKLYGALRPLYAHPQPKREPLTDEEKSNLWEISRAALPRYATYANLIEAAHGITKG